MTSSLKSLTSPPHLTSVYRVDSARHVPELPLAGPAQGGGLQQAEPTRLRGLLPVGRGQLLGKAGLQALLRLRVRPCQRHRGHNEGDLRSRPHRWVVQLCCSRTLLLYTLIRTKLRNLGSKCEIPRHGATGHINSCCQTTLPTKGQKRNTVGVRSDMSLPA